MAEKIVIELTVDSSGAVTGIDSFNKALGKTNQTGDKATIGFTKLTGAVAAGQAVYRAFATGLNVVIGSMGDFIRASNESNAAFIGVKKTLDTTGLSVAETEVLFRQMSGELADLALQIPVTFEELSAIGEIGGQLGIAAMDLTDFTEVVAKLGETTNLTAESAATSLARFANVTDGIDATNFQAVGSALVELGNNTQTTEAEILSFSQRIAATATIAGFTQSEILALGASFSSAGIEAEAGGTAVQKTIIAMTEAVAQGGEELALFASVAGQSTEDFANTFRTEPVQAFQKVLAGLAREGTGAFQVIENLGLGSERTKTALLSGAQAAAGMEKAVTDANAAFQKSIDIQNGLIDTVGELDALNREAELRFNSFGSQIDIAAEAFSQVQGAIGDFITQSNAAGEIVKFFTSTLVQLRDWLQNDREAAIAYAGDGLLLLVDALDVASQATQIFIGALQTVLVVGGAFLTGLFAIGEALLQLGNAFGIVDDQTVAISTALKDRLGEATDAVARASFAANEKVQGFQDSLGGLRDAVANATAKQLEHEAVLAKTNLRYPESAAGAEETGDAVDDLGGSAGMASEELQKLNEQLGKLSIDQLGKDAALLTASIESFGGAANLSVAQLEAASKQIANFEKNGIALGSTLQEVKMRLDEIAKTKAIDKLAASFAKLGKVGAKDIEIVVGAIEKLGGISKLTDKQIEAVSAELKKMGVSGKQAADAGLGAIEQRLDSIAQSKALEEINEELARLSGQVSGEGRDAFNDLTIALFQARDAGIELSDEAIAAVIDRMNELAETDPGLKEEITALADEFDIASTSAIDFGSIIFDLSNIMTAFGLSADSTLGGIVAGFQQLGSALPAIQDFDASILGNQDLSGAEKFQAGAGAVAGGIAGVAQATSRGGAGSSAAGGALAGAAAGGQLAGPIGAVVGGIGGAIVGFFRGRGRDKVRKDIDEALGSSISEELSQNIKQQAEDAGRSLEQEAFLNLGEIIAEGGIEGFDQGLEGVSAAAIGLLQGITDGTLPAKEGIRELGEAFSLMAEDSFVAGQVADAALINVVKAARESGQDIPEIAAFVEDQLNVAAQGISKVIGGIQIFNVEDAQDQATIFAGAFFATVEEVGILEAVDAFGPAFEELRTQIAQFGGDVNLGGVGRIFEIAGQEEFRPLLEGVQGLDEALSGLSNTGFLTADSFQAFQNQASDAFAQLQAAGLGPEEALQQMGPLLNNLVQASNEFGFELDANTQGLISQAEAAGVAFRVEPMQQVADTLVVIAELLGATDDQLANLGGTAQTTSEQVGGLKPALDGLQDPVLATDAALQGVGDTVGGLGEVAAQSGEQMVQSFQAASAGIVEGLGPVSDKIENEIRQVGDETSKAIDSSFKSTNEAIKTGLGTVAQTFTGQVAPAALQAAKATEQIASAALEAAKAAKSIEFDFGGENGPASERSSAGGFRGLLQKDTSFDAHAGELVNIVPASNVRNMRARGDRVSAQGGFGGIALDLGGISIEMNEIQRPQTDESDEGGPARMTDEEFAEQLGRVVVENIGSVVEDKLRESLFEQT